MFKYVQQPDPHPYTEWKTYEEVLVPLSKMEDVARLRDEQKEKFGIEARRCLGQLRALQVAAVLLLRVYSILSSLYVQPVGVVALKCGAEA